MILLSAQQTVLQAEQTEILTAGAVNVFQCQFAFSPEWDNLQKTAVFMAGSTSVSIALNSENECAVPWEALQYAGRTLFAGVYGTYNDEVVLPTIWASLGVIQAAASPAASTQPPTPTVYEQLLAEIGNLEDLSTVAKDSLVAAINEIYQSGGGSGGGGNVYSPDITQILVMDQVEYDSLLSKSPTTLYLIRG